MYVEFIRGGKTRVVQMGPTILPNQVAEILGIEEEDWRELTQQEFDTYIAIQQVEAEIRALDSTCVAPLRAVQSGKATVYDLLALSDSESRIEELKQELEGLRPSPTPPSLTIDQMQIAFTLAIQKRLDDFAKTRGYDGIMSAATYATSTNPKFAMEGQYAVESRDDTWAEAYMILGHVLGGIRPMPSIEEVFQELPELIWPDEVE